MLEQVLAHLRNWFVKHIERGTFVIEGGGIELPFLQDGQYFRIVGSLFNDGVYRYDGELTLLDETFNGLVWALAIPPAVIELVEKIKEWEVKNAETIHSPYISESFGGYTYTKATSSSSASAATWQSAFRSELNRWRKI